MPVLKERPTLGDLQAYVRVLEEEGGFAAQDLLQKCLLLGEEVGELFKAVRKHERMAVDPASRVGAAGEELADILIFLCAIANRLGVDLEREFRGKELKNESREWRPHG